MHDNSGLSTEAGDEADTLDALSDALNAVNAENAPSRIVKRLGTALKSTDTTKGTTKPIQTNRGQEESTYTVTYAPSFQQTYALSKVADFDARLTLIEAALGIGTIPLPAQDTFPNKAVLPVLDSLDRQLSTLSSSTETSVDLIDRKVRQLTEDAQKLTDARTAARAAQKALNLTLIQSEHPPAETDEMKTLGGIVDAEHTSKINALYGTLATIDSLAPLLPSVLDRLRSLQSIHVDASNASQSLADLQIRQEAMLEDLRSWRGGLEKVEEAVKHGEQTMTGNVRVVESWVKELEDRMQKLGQ